MDKEQALRELLKERRTNMKSLIQVLIARAEHVYEEVNGLTPNTDIRDWSFEDLTYQAQELIKVVQAIETLRRAQELTEE